MLRRKEKSQQRESWCGRRVEVPISELGSGQTQDLWLDVQPPDEDEPSASEAKSRRKMAKASKKESKHVERLHKNGKQCRLHLQVCDRTPWFSASS